MPSRPAVQLIDPGRADELGGRVPAQHVQVQQAGAGQWLTFARPDGRDQHGPQARPPGEPEPVGQRRASQMRVVHDGDQRGAFGQPGQHPDQGGVQHRGAEHAVGQGQPAAAAARSRRGAEHRCPSTAASTGASEPSRSVAAPGPSRRSSPASAVSSASSGMARSSGPQGASSTMSPAAARRAAQARSSVVFPMPASPSTTMTSAAPPRPRARPRRGRPARRPGRPGPRWAGHARLAGAGPAAQAQPAALPAGGGPPGPARRAGSRCTAPASPATGRCPVPRPAVPGCWRTRPARPPPGRPARRRAAGPAAPPRRRAPAPAPRPPRRRRPSSRPRPAARRPPPGGCG